MELVIFDLDGTLLDSERVVQATVRSLVVDRYKCEYTREVAAAGLGMRPLEACQALVEAAKLPCTAEEVMALTGPALEKEWESVAMLPGAQRLVEHLLTEGVPVALATSSKSSSLALKLKTHPVLRKAFLEGNGAVAVTGDQVSKGKPAPDIFLEAMRRSGVTTDPSKCIVFEDAPSGVAAAVAAGMKAIAIPSVLESGRLGTSNGEFKAADAVLSCLYDFKPEAYGLTPFNDVVGGEVVKVEPWRIAGEVVRGIGRGSKSLGIPTANLPPAAWDQCTGGVPANTSGIYAGWASVGDDPAVYPTALSVGWNPHFDKVDAGTTDSHSATGKTLEPWILHDFGRDFYGEELRLVVCGYIRPEVPFTTIEALIERIHEVFEK